MTAQCIQKTTLSINPIRNNNYESNVIRPDVSVRRNGTVHTSESLNFQVHTERTAVLLPR